MFSSAKQYAILILFGTILASFSLASIILFSDPTTSGWLTFLFFYTSVFLVSLGVFTFFGLLIRAILKRKLYIVNLSNSFRQALLISSFLSFSLYLQSEKLLYWWVEMSLVLFFACLEIFLNLKV